MESQRSVSSFLFDVLTEPNHLPIFLVIAVVVGLLWWSMRATRSMSSEPGTPGTTSHASPADVQSRGKTMKRDT